MARIPLPTTETLTAAQRRVYDAIVVGPRGGVRGPFLAALHSPDLADKWQQLGELLRYRTSLPPRLSELAILITARFWDCQFEWHAHEQHALNGGVAKVAIDDIRHHRVPNFEQADERAVYEYTKELHERRTVGQETHGRLVAALGLVAAVEMTALIGYYTMVAMTLNAHEILPPPDVPLPLPVPAPGS